MPTAVELVTPERVLYSGEAGFVVLRTDDGEIMFLPEHAPFIAAVDICVVRIDTTGGEPGASSTSGSSTGGGRDGAGGSSGGAGATAAGAGTSVTGAGEVRAAVAGGFVHVADNRVTVLAGVAELADQIDVARARRAFESASAEAAASPSGGGGTGHAGGASGAAREGDATEMSRRQAAAAAGVPAAGAEGSGEEAQKEIAETPTMRALLFPDAPDVRARRAANRLEAAGEADQNIAAIAAGAAGAVPAQAH